MNSLQTFFNQKIESITSDKSTRIASMQYAVSEGDNIILSGSSGFSDRDKEYKKITVRMLLNHTAGIEGTTQRNVIVREINDTDGFTLAQLLVERVSGKDFATYIRENISEPLEVGMAILSGLLYYKSLMGKK